MKTTAPLVSVLAPLLASLLAPTAATVAQDAARPAKPPFVVEAGDTELATLIDRSAAYLDCNIVWKEADLASQGGVSIVRLQAPITTDRDGCLDFLADALYRHGLVLTWSNERLRIMEAINIGGPRGREVLTRAVARTEAEVMARPSLRMPVTVTLPLQHVNATIATNALRPFFAATGMSPGGSTLTIGNVGSSTAMIVSGMQDQVAQAIRVLRESDLPGKPEPEVADATKRIQALEKRIETLEARLEQLGKQSK